MSYTPINPTPKLLDQVHDRLRVKHYSIRTEEVYLQWIKRFILFHGKRHPNELSAAEIEQFLTDLAVNRHVSSATQNQALAGLLFLYREVLGIDLPWLDNIARAKRPQRLPVVLTRNEVRAVLMRITGVYGLMANLLYGSGIRLMECVRLRGYPLKTGQLSENNVISAWIAEIQNTRTYLTLCHLAPGFRQSMPE